MFGNNGVYEVRNKELAVGVNDKSCRRIKRTDCLKRCLRVKQVVVNESGESFTVGEKNRTLCKRTHGSGR